MLPSSRITHSHSHHGFMVGFVKIVGPNTLFRAGSLLFVTSDEADDFGITMVRQRSDWNNHESWLGITRRILQNDELRSTPYIYISYLTDGWSPPSTVKPCHVLEHTHLSRPLWSYISTERNIQSTLSWTSCRCPTRWHSSSLIVSWSDWNERLGDPSLEPVLVLTPLCGTVEVHFIIF